MTEYPVDKQHSGGLVREFGTFDSTMMMIGLVIGSGIFTTTGIMAGALPSPGLILIVWIFGGLMTLAGALTYAELGAALPEAGGHYVYLREAYGPIWGFLFGWQLFLVAMTGSIAALAVAFAEYFGYFFPALSTGSYIMNVTLSGDWQYTLSMGQIVAVVLIVLLSFFNFIGLVFGKIVQNVLSVLKIGIILLFVVLGLTAGRGTPVDLSLNPMGWGAGGLLTGFGVAFIAVSWAFDGWNNINYIAGEIKNPKRNLPFALIGGTVIITVLYLLVNYVYFYALPVEQMAGVVRIAEKATTSLFGGRTADFISIAVMISVLGALHGAVIVGPRVSWAMAKDGVFFQRVADVHPRFHTPGFSILIQALWACFLTITGTFEQLFTFVMFVTIVFWIAGVGAVFVLRKKRPDLPRPYKTWGYPVVPALFILVSVAILFNALSERPVESLAGVGLTLIGIPVYYYWKKRTG
ncbi:APC family permease [candidate division KSB1 bacterium]